MQNTGGNHDLLNTPELGNFFKTGGSSQRAGWEKMLAAPPPGGSAAPPGVSVWKKGAAGWTPGGQGPGFKKHPDFNEAAPK